MNAAVIEEAERIADELLDERAKARERSRVRRALTRAKYPPGDKYWGGKPCEKHPGTPRYRSSSACVGCAIEHVYAWRQKRKGKA